MVDHAKVSAGEFVELAGCSPRLPLRLQNYLRFDDDDDDLIVFVSTLLMHLQN